MSQFLFKLKTLLRIKREGIGFVKALFFEILNLINVYGPNNDDSNFSFFPNDLFFTLSTLQGSLIIGGDFNCALNPKLDRSSGVDQSHISCKAVIHRFMEDLQIMDIWRERNQNTKTYSCHSGTHQSYSRIDFFLISTMLQSKVYVCSYDNIVVSDHAPCCLVYRDVKLKREPQGGNFSINGYRMKIW